MRKTTYLTMAPVLLVLLLVSLPGAKSRSGAKAPADVPRQKVVELDAKGRKELRILAGAPESYRMRAGLIVLAPGDSVGRHSTQQNEEVLVVLEGSGEMVFGDGSRLPVHANSALYCPPETTHDVLNTDHAVLRYVYVVSRAK
jgi:mannose-6-phosphate isomerase-like protein (cupin superfamily)